MTTRSAESEVAAFVRSWSGDADELRRQFAEWLWRDETDDAFPAAALRDPHALGWLHQYLAESDRQEAFREHTSFESKHTSQTATTQLYTPRWVADWLVEKCLDVTPRPASVLDPACGGGQMLLAAAAALVTRGADPVLAYGSMRGIDLDADAVWACRESLKLAARRTLGRREPDLEAAIDRQVRVGDGLSGELEPADIVVTNPPYMGSRSMPARLKEALAAYRPFHGDLYLAFVKRCADLTEGAMGILAQQTLWYLKRFEKARCALLEAGELTDFAHLGHGVFDALKGEKANVVAFVWSSDRTAAPTTCRFWDARSEEPSTVLRSEPTELSLDRFDDLPATPLAFWLPDRLFELFAAGERLADVAEVPGSQNKTGNNARYVRSCDDVPDDGAWVPYSKGGRFAPWWGNWDWVVDWSDEARQFYASNPTSNLLDEKYWFREGLCYSDFGGRHFNARWMPPGCVFDMAGPAIFVDGDDHDLLAALLVVLNSTASRTVLNALNPTLHYQVRDVRNLPLPRWDDAVIARLATLGHELVSLTRELLDGPTDSGDLLAAEFAADAVVAEAYGCRDLVTAVDDRRVHHRLARA